MQLCTGILCQGTQSWSCSTQEQQQTTLAGTAGLPTHCPPQPSQPTALQSTQRVTVTSATSRATGKWDLVLLERAQRVTAPRMGSWAQGQKGQ